MDLELVGKVAIVTGERRGALARPWPSGCSKKAAG